MLYLSLALIFLGIVIFLFSLILDAKRRNEAQNSSAAQVAHARQGTAAPAATNPAADNEAKNRGKRPPLSMPKEPSKERNLPAGSAPQQDRQRKAVLFEDKSSIIDYGSESGSIDPSLEKYKNIKRIGDGTISVETGGITFYMGKKLYRYDFHRVRDVKAGKNHLALFLMGSGSVKLFIIEPGSGITTAATDAFREYVRSSA